MEELKNRYRQQMRQEVNSHSPEWIAAHSRLVTGRLENDPLFIRARRLALYYPLHGEIDTIPLLECWKHSKALFLPLVSGTTLHLLPYFPGDKLVEGAFGTMYPEGALPHLVDTDCIDLIIVPGLAFDRQGNRLGRGKGFYDRFLSTLNTPRIGICFQYQLLDEVPFNVEDIPMDKIITEKETLCLI
ncbi:MAG: 5-formyltetrahydrofolate cyclo-ligase [Tannerellaceae bacterium]|jgi:5-formyltetrahydrofolate cyclo-ligase|nr:5-formyltetrahydrofolate cyclo-ligase [Tannerellaceae bacterium]